MPGPTHSRPSARRSLRRADHLRWGPSGLVRLARHALVPWAAMALVTLALVAGAGSAPPTEVPGSAPGPTVSAPATGAGPVAAGLTSGQVALAVPVGPAAPPLAAGDPVHLVAVADPFLGGSATGEVTVVAHRARVIHVSDSAITVAVAEDEVGPTLWALAVGIVSPVVVG